MLPRRSLLIVTSPPIPATAPHHLAVDWISQLPFARHTPPSRSHRACRRGTGNALESEDEKPVQPKHTARTARTRSIVLLFMSRFPNRSLSRQPRFLSPAP